MLTALQATMLPSWRCALAENLRSVLLANAALQEAVDLLYALLHRCRDSSDVISSPARKSAPIRNPAPAALPVTASPLVWAGARTEAGKAGQQDDYGAVWDAVEALPARWRAALFTDAVQ